MYLGEIGALIKLVISITCYSTFQILYLCLNGESLATKWARFLLLIPSEFSLTANLLPACGILVSVILPVFFLKCKNQVV